MIATSRRRGSRAAHRARPRRGGAQRIRAPARLRRRVRVRRDLGLCRVPQRRGARARRERRRARRDRARAARARRAARASCRPTACSTGRQPFRARGRPRPTARPPTAARRRSPRRACARSTRARRYCASRACSCRASRCSRAGRETLRAREPVEAFADMVAAPIHVDHVVTALLAIARARSRGHPPALGAPRGHATSRSRATSRRASALRRISCGRSPPRRAGSGPARRRATRRSRATTSRRLAPIEPFDVVDAVLGRYGGIARFARFPALRSVPDDRHEAHAAPGRAAEVVREAELRVRRSGAGPPRRAAGATSRTSCAGREAPIGWPKLLRPPSGFTGCAPSRSKRPSSTSFHACAARARSPRSSISTSSVGVKQSCTSAMLISFARVR